MEPNYDSIDFSPACAGNTTYPDSFMGSSRNEDISIILFSGICQTSITRISYFMATQFLGNETIRILM